MQSSQAKAENASSHLFFIAIFRDTQMLHFLFLFHSYSYIFSQPSPFVTISGDPAFHSLLNSQEIVFVYSIILAVYKDK
jgi:hypothetical protein